MIGDQSGIEHVLHNPGGVLHGRTLDNNTRSGMGEQSDSRFVGFEEGGWDEGFYGHSSVNTGSWRDGFFITSWVKNADHIISLPRVSAHSQARATLGLKGMVGMLREDSRMEFHANGPYNVFIPGLDGGARFHPLMTGAVHFSRRSWRSATRSAISSGSPSVLQRRYRQPLARTGTASGPVRLRLGGHTWCGLIHPLIGLGGMPDGTEFEGVPAPARERLRGLLR